MNTTDNKIAEVLAKFGEPMAGNVWRVQGQPVIYHKTLERIAAQAQIQFGLPQILRSERDEAVMLVMGSMGEREEWSIGEALIGVNYRVSGKQAAYVYAMAEKRAKDRVILKLIELHGLVYSEQEADEFEAPAPPVAVRHIPKPEHAPPPLPDLDASRRRVEAAGGKGIREYMSEDRADAAQAASIEKPEPEVAANDAKRKLSDLPPSAQAALTAQKPAFWRFLNETFAANVSTESGATEEIYKACGVETRRDLLPGSKAEMRWLALRRRFEQWCQDAPV